MKRPISWVHWGALFLLLVAIGEYAAVTWLARQYVLRVAERLAGGLISVDEARLSFPLTTTLTGVHLLSNTPDALLSAQRITIHPRWFSASTRTLSLNSIVIDRPHLRLIRTAEGTFVWPAWPPSSGRGAGALPRSLWRVRIESLRVEDGVVELVDYKTPTPFHGVLHHVSFVVGPLTIPLGGPQMSFAVRGELVGHGGDAAPVYCSGWLDIPARNLQASCKLEPLPLAAFDPYFRQGSVKIHVYDATVKSTSQWVAHANELEGRIQVELGNLREGDLSVRGRTVVDIKKLTEGEAPRLSAEFKIGGPLDNPSAWHSDFVPGDAQAQQLVKPLLDRGIEMIRIPFGNRKLGVGITAANLDTMNAIEQASKQVDQDLELLAIPAHGTPPAPQAPAPAPSVEVLPNAPPAASSPPAAVVAPAPAQPDAAAPVEGEPSSAVPPVPAAPPAPAAPAPPPPTAPPNAPDASSGASSVPAVPSSAPSSDTGSATGL